MKQCVAASVPRVVFKQNLKKKKKNPQARSSASDAGRGAVRLADATSACSQTAAAANASAAADYGTDVLFLCSGMKSSNRQGSSFLLEPVETTSVCPISEHD